MRLQLHALAYKLGNFLHTLARPEPIKDWSLTSLKEKLIKVGAKVVRLRRTRWRFGLGLGHHPRNGLKTDPPQEAECLTSYSFSRIVSANRNIAQKNACKGPVERTLVHRLRAPRLEQVISRSGVKMPTTTEPKAVELPQRE